VELPHIEQMAREFRARGVDFITVSTYVHAVAQDDSVKRQSSIKDETEKLSQMAAVNGMTMPVGMAPPGSQFHTDYYVPNAQMIIIDPSGKVRYQGNMDLDRLREELGKALRAGASRP
jgi:hypothetical protein